jgi:hypothetical protein
MSLAAMPCEVAGGVSTAKGALGTGGRGSYIHVVNQCLISNAKKSPEKATKRQKMGYTGGFFRASN